MQYLLTEKEYNDLVYYRNLVDERMSELSEIVDDKDKLQEYIRDWLGE